MQVDLPGRTTSDYGTGLHYQPGGDKYEDFLNGRSVADGRILTPGKETTFERNALDKGLSVVTGASGSTNIMVHLNNYLAAKDPAYSPSQAYLNTLAFLVFDGGHSVNESLAVYRALQESGDARKQVLESYTANYRDLVDLAGEDSKASVQAALDGAFGTVLSSSISSMPIRRSSMSWSLLARHARAIRLPMASCQQAPANPSPWRTMVRPAGQAATQSADPLPQ